MPGVYSRISFFFDWISKTVCEVSIDPPDYLDCQKELEFINWDPWKKLGRCQGDCDKDEDCNGDMVCFISTLGSAPGCGDKADSAPCILSNFCAFDKDFRSIHVRVSEDPFVLELVHWDPLHLLGHCQGDCDKDEDCAGDMICFFDSTGTGFVPGCNPNYGLDYFIANFCVYQAAEVTEAPTFLPTQYSTGDPILIGALNQLDDNTRVPTSISVDDSTLVPTASLAPSISSSPSFSPSVSITPSASSSPSEHPTEYPTNEPSMSSSPSFSPSVSITPSASSSPSEHPKEYPTNEPSTTNAPSMSSSPSFSPSASPSFEDYLVLVNWDPFAPLEHCQGDCDKDEDCEENMVCYFDPTGSGIVPGCGPNYGLDYQIANFCIYRVTEVPSQAPSQYQTERPTKKPSVSLSPSFSDNLDLVGWDPVDPLEHCQGDCDKDEDCAGNMVCYFDTTGSGSAPGCGPNYGLDYQIANFCVYRVTEVPSLTPSQHPTDHPTKEPSVSLSPSFSDNLDLVGWDPVDPLEHCQGDCDNDEDCAGGMVCYSDPTGSGYVPGCGPNYGWDYQIANFCVYRVTESSTFPT